MMRNMFLFEKILFDGDKIGDNDLDTIVTLKMLNFERTRPARKYGCERPFYGM